MYNAKFVSYKDNKPNRARQLLKSFVILVLTYSLLMACWLLVGKTYSRFYCSCGELLFGSFGSRGIVEFGESKKEGYDIAVRLYNADRTNKNGVMRGVETSQNNRQDVYMYVVFLVALIVATPISVRRKLWALLWGVILIHCFVFLRLAGYIFEQFSEDSLGLFSISPSWKSTFYTLYQQFIANVNFGFVVAVFIWILVTFRRRDWERIIATQGRGGKK